MNQFLISNLYSYLNVHPFTLGGVTDPVVLQAALLHDTVEDTETTFEEIEAEFGKEVVG